MHDAIGSFLGDLFDRYDLPHPLPKPDVIIESFPPSMILGRSPEGWFMRWVPYGGGQVHGDRWPDSAGQRPQVAVSMGTIELQAFGLGAVESVVAAAAQVDADFVLALGDLDVAPLRPLPENVRAIGWTALHRLLHHCTAVVHHGSGGMIMTSIESCTPQLLAPDARDMFQHSGRDAVRQLGIGLVSTADEVTPELLTELIEDTGLAQRMATVRDEVHALPTPADTVRRIVAEI
jgi:UDP:flavonoid glycosyltransferase YjiC (YdhE family)